MGTADYADLRGGEIVTRQPCINKRLERWLPFGNHMEATEQLEQVSAPPLTRWRCLSLTTYLGFWRLRPALRWAWIDCLTSPWLEQ